MQTLIRLIIISLAITFVYTAWEGGHEKLYGKDIWLNRHNPISGIANMAVSFLTGVPLTIVEPYRYVGENIRLYKKTRKKTNEDGKRKEDTQK